MKEQMKLNEVALRYFGMLDMAGATPIRSKTPSTDDMHHLAWMLQQILYDGEQSLTKKHRWLGFVQACLIVAGFLTIDGERNATRYIFDGS